MRITIYTLNGVSHTLNPDPNDTIEDAMRLLQEQTGIPPSRMRFIYGGKALNPVRTLVDYNIYEGSTIHLVLRLTGGIPDSTDVVQLVPENSAFPTNKDAEKTIKEWHTLAQKGNFDADIHIVAPHAYYAELESTEQKVVLRSQWIRQGGDLAGYGPETWSMIHDLKSIPTTPPWIQDLVEDLNRNGGAPVDRALMTICEIYRTLLGLIETFGMLKKQKFCSTFFSILVEQSQGAIAELVRVREEDLNNLLEGLEFALTFASNRERLLLEEGDDVVMQSLMAPAETMLTVLGSKELSPMVTTLEEALDLSRMLVYLLDLGMVFYVGSHTSTLDKLASDQEINGMGLDDQSVFNFTCRKQPLACLGGFLDDNSVWVFHFGSREVTSPNRKFAILTTIEVLADVWGPVWAEAKNTINPGDEQRITKYSVSKGCIRRVRSNAPCEVPGAIRCHWYNWAHDFRLRFSNLVTRSEELTMSVNDKLLIGTELRLNPNCNYTLQEYEMSYDQMMRPLGPRPSSWKLDGATLGIQIAAPKVVAFQIQGNVKKVPETTIKQFIMEKWRFEPERANPGILNSYFGLEISHCTGNARRVPLKYILLMPCVQEMLERQIPGWTLTQWGMSFIKAMQVESDEAIFAFWIQHPHERPLVGQLVRSVLDVLDSTGKDDVGFHAAFLHGNSEHGVDIDERNNEWAHLLRDTFLMATYAIVNETCLECRQPDHTAAICNDEPRYTVLQTQVELRKGDVLRDRLRIEPHNQTFRQVDKEPAIQRTPQYLAPEVALKRALLGSYNLAIAKEVSTQKEHPSGDIAKVTIRASGRSFGGMRYKREHIMLNARADQATGMGCGTGFMSTPEDLTQIEIEELIKAQQKQEREHIITRG
ncbi:hypothetical protein COCSADRAFT_115413 [Bipolaris sorokiniana ND90Pr]|uniref:Ubiquitin-like domain-containing protein n=1 Tax=Cochliobolus sativus (strain ND90Pr / ATCC 201652) TaxID=665912 RepID=M2T5W6_COCSN|nr:uncharacterized protein COCSADRAFT_115413 [Bipolaris sorokiniana ND90Pr]EMD64591.1 hypothetical protein COCSADRAFT_115413 [Bipolaris sorokiniana ND90Pr]